jgi:hypothetical protein
MVIHFVRKTTDLTQEEVRRGCSANFVLTAFSEVNCPRARETRALLALSPATSLEKPRGARSYQPGEGERGLRSHQEAQKCPHVYGLFVERERGQHTEQRNPRS